MQRRVGLIAPHHLTPVCDKRLNHDVNHREVTEFRAKAAPGRDSVVRASVGSAVPTPYFPL